MSTVIINIQGDVTIHCYHTPTDFKPYKFSFPKDYDLISLEKDMRNSNHKYWHEFLPERFKEEISHALFELRRRKKKEEAKNIFL